MKRFAISILVGGLPVLILPAGLLADGDRSIDRDDDPSGFHVEFRYSPAKGLGLEPGITRRDPSDVIRVNDTWYVWYTRTSKGRSGYDATIWYADSPDGHTWHERDEALARGGKGAWDERSVFTPNIMVVENRYYLFYTGVPQPFDERTKTAIGLAMADSPDGPWKRISENPVLTTGTSGRWDGPTGTNADPKGAWDSHRVDDACLLVRDGTYWLYYKGRRMGLGPSQTKMGVAVAKRPTGPYVKHEANPVIASGHEVLVWPYREGVVSLIGPAGPEKNTIQFAPDGLTFTVKARLENVPKAPGAYRPHAFTGIRSERAVTWGISMINHPQWPYLVRFDCVAATAK